jgi:hypothetical protein
MSPVFPVAPCVFRGEIRKAITKRTLREEGGHRGGAASMKKGSERKVRRSYFATLPWLATSFHIPPILTKVSVLMTVVLRCSPIINASYVSLYVAIAVLP